MQIPRNDMETKNHPKNSTNSIVFVIIFADKLSKSAIGLFQTFLIFYIPKFSIFSFSKIFSFFHFFIFLQIRYLKNIFKNFEYC